MTHNYLKFRIENKTDNYVLMYADNIKIDDTSYTGNCISRIAGQSVGYLFLESSTPIFKIGTYETIQFRITPYVEGYIAGSYFYELLVSADSEDPNNLEVSCQICDISDTQQKESTENGQVNKSLQEVLDDTLISYTSYLGHTKTEIGLPDENKVDDNYYYLGKANFLGEERNIYVYIGDEETAWSLRVGDDSDYPDLDTLKNQLNQTCGEPDISTEYGCSYYDRELHLMLRVSGLDKIILDEHYNMTLIPIVTISQHRFEE